MSEESATPDLVERTRRVSEAADRGDFDAMVSVCAPDAVWEVVGLGAFEGAAAIRRFLQDWLGGYTEYEVKAQEILDLGNGVVFAITRQNGRPAGSTGGEKVREVWTYTFLWIDGMVMRVAGYPDIDEGRAAAEKLAQARASAMSQESS